MNGELIVKRRTILQAMALSGVTQNLIASQQGEVLTPTPEPAVPSPAFDSMEATRQPEILTRIGVVCIGANGNCNFKSVAKGNVYVSRRILVTTSGTNADNQRADQCIHIDDLASYPDLHQRLERELSTITGFQLLVIVADMGSMEGQVIAPAIARIAANAGVHALCAMVTTTASDEWLKAFNRAAVLLLNEPHLSRIDGSSWTPDALSSLNRFLYRTGVATNVNLHVSLDADELRRIFPLGSIATLGVGFGTGINRGLTAVHSAIENPMLGPARLQSADSVLVNINAPVGYRLSESNAVMKMVRSQCKEGVYLIYTCRTDQLADDNLEVSISASRALEGANA